MRLVQCNSDTNRPFFANKCDLYFKLEKYNNVSDFSVSFQLRWLMVASGWAVSAAMFKPADCSCGTLQRFLPQSWLYGYKKDKGTILWTWTISNEWGHDEIDECLQQEGGVCQEEDYNMMNTLEEHNSMVDEYYNMKDELLERGL
jgi:hypothetical protein